MFSKTLLNPFSSNREDLSFNRREGVELEGVSTRSMHIESASTLVRRMAGKIVFKTRNRTKNWREGKILVYIIR
jgi:hypothetical protein